MHKGKCFFFKLSDVVISMASFKRDELHNTSLILKVGIKIIISLPDIKFS